MISGNSKYMYWHLNKIYYQDRYNVLFAKIKYDVMAHIHMKLMKYHGSCLDKYGKSDTFNIDQIIKPHSS